MFQFLQRLETLLVDQNKDRRRRHEMELKNNRNQSVEVMKSHMTELFWFHSRVQGVSGQRRTLLSMPTNHRSRIHFSSYIHATEERYRVYPLGSRTVVHKLHGCREWKGRGVTPPPVNHRTAQTFNLSHLSRQVELLSSLGGSGNIWTAVVSHFTSYNEDRTRLDGEVRDQQRL